MEPIRQTQGGRKRHYAVEGLTPRGRVIVEDGLGANGTYQQIVDTLRKETGEKLPVSSLQRYHAKRWFPTRQALEETGRLFDLVKESLEKSQGKKLDEVSSELLKTHLFKALAAVKDPDPLKLYSLVISEGWLGVEKEKVGVQKERLGVMRERLKQLERTLSLKEEEWERTREKVDKAAGNIETMGKKKGLDAETLKKIREEVYGIVEAPV